MSAATAALASARPLAIKGVRLPRDAALKEEQADEYAPGGYRQIHVGDSINNGRYRVVRKLGFGHFSTVWLVKDERRSKHVALKVVKSAYKYAQTAIDEIALLRIIQHEDRGGLNHPGRKHIVEFLDCFALHPSRDNVLLPLDREDPSPRHVCMTFEPLGENLLTLMKRLATCDETNLKIGIPTVLVQQIVRQMLQALDFLHSNCRLIHTDLKLENVIVVAEDVEELVRACTASEYMTGVSPSNATRVVPLKETSSSSISSTPAFPGVGAAGAGIGGKPSPSSGSKNAFANWERNVSPSSPREITITGSAPLPSPMHAWGRVNVGPEVNSLAFIMAQLALERKMAEGGISQDANDKHSSSTSEQLTGDAAASSCCDDDDSRPHMSHRHSHSHLPPHLNSHHHPHLPELHHRRTWAGPNPNPSTSSSSASTHSADSLSTPSAWTAAGSGASSLASVNSSATLFSMTTSGVSTAPTSMENSLILPSSGLVAMSAGVTPGKQHLVKHSPLQQTEDDSPSSKMMMTPFSFEPDLSEEQDSLFSKVSISQTTKNKRLSSQSDLTLMREDLASSSASASIFPVSLSPSKDATLTPTPTPNPFSQQSALQQQSHPSNATASLLTAKKPANVNVNMNMALAGHPAANAPTPTSTTPTPNLPYAAPSISSPFLSASPSSTSTNMRGRHLTDPSSSDPFLKSSPTLPKPPPRIRIKIADMGNATPIAKHFTPDIQTRPYRAPEVILGYKNWDESVDIWSVGCMVFELLTSDLLFFAEEDKKWGKYSRDDDQLAQITELLGDFPWNRKWGGRYSKDFFNPQGGLRRVAKLRPWSLRAVLMQKYDYPQEQAERLRDFILPMLALDPNDRPSAAELAKHPWLDDPDAAPPYAADRVSASDEFYKVEDARLAQVLQALHNVSIQQQQAKQSQQTPIQA